MHYMYGSATVLQILWTSLAVLGLLITSHLLLEAQEDMRALKRAPTYKPGGMRHIIAKANVRNTRYRAITLALLAAIGLASMLAPAPLSYRVITLRAVLQTIGFVSVEIIIVLNAIADRRDRNALFYQIRTRRFDQLMPVLEAQREVVRDGHDGRDWNGEVPANEGA